MTNYPKTPEEFKRLVGDYQATDRFKAPLLFAVGRQVVTGNGTLASVRYPVVNGPRTNLGTAAILMKVLGIDPSSDIVNIPLSSSQLGEVLRYFEQFKHDGKVHANIKALEFALASQKHSDRHKNLQGELVASFIFNDVDPRGVEDSTLKLYGFSNRLFKPGQLNVKKIFTKLPNVAWVGDKPMDADEVDSWLMGAAFDNNPFAPHMVDKFPLYVHRINAGKMGVRITDQHKVRLGAYLGEGTTIMPGASYVNFNAGTEGPSMVEGRISSSAFVGAGSDVGGGASILGTLSGGNDIPISVGRNCLLEVNSALGIPIGDAVIIAATTAVMASSQVTVALKDHPLFGKVVKAAELAGINGVTFRRNDTSGQLEVVRTRRNVEFARKLADGDSILSADLHKNN